jgi:O-antigen ligase
MMVTLAALLVAASLPVNGKALGYLIKPALLWFFLYALVAVFSSLYASMAFYSLGKALELIVVAAAVALILGRVSQWRGIETAYNLTLIMLGLVAVTPWLWLIVVPSEVLVPAKSMLTVTMMGPLPPLNPNALASLAAIIGIASMARWLEGTRRPKVYVFILVASLITLILSFSRTSILGFLVGLLTYAYFDRRRKLFVFALLVIVLGVLIGGLRELVFEYLLRGQHVESVKSLSGRTAAWQMAWDYFLLSPYVGHGFASAGRYDVLHDATSHLHGSIFDILVGVGLAGAIPWLLMFAWTGIRLLNPKGVAVAYLTPQGRSKRAELLAMLAFLIIRGVTTSNLATHSMETMLLLVIVAYSMISWDVVGAAYKGATPNVRVGSANTRSLCMETESSSHRQTDVEGKAYILSYKVSDGKRKADEERS